MSKQKTSVQKRRAFNARTEFTRSRIGLRVRRESDARRRSVCNGSNGCVCMCVCACVKRGRRCNACNGSNGHGPVEAGLADDAAGGLGVEPGRNGSNGPLDEQPAPDFPTEEDAANMLAEMLSQGVEPARNGSNGLAYERHTVTHAQEEEDAANMLAGMLSKLQRFRRGGRAGAGAAGAREASVREMKKDGHADLSVINTAMGHVGVSVMSHVGLREQHADKKAVQAEKA